MPKKTIRMIEVLALVLFLGGASWASAKEEADKAGEFYKGKKVDYTIPTSVGDPNDLIGRAIASRFSKLTGATAIVVNRKEAGGLEGYAHVYRAKPDGLTIGVCGMSLVLTLNKIMDEPGAQYDLEKFGYLCGINRERAVFCVNSKGPYQSISDLKAAKNIRLGGTTPAGNISLGGMSVIHILDLNAKIVTGIKGVSALILAIQQEQSVGGAFPVGAALTAIKAGQLKPLFIIGSERAKPLLDTPALTELVQLQGEKLKMAKIWDLLFQSRLFFSPPGVPKDRLSFLSEVFTKILNEQEYYQRINSFIGYESEILGGEDLTKIIEAIAKEKDATKQMFHELINRYRL